MVQIIDREREQKVKISILCKKVIAVNFKVPPRTNKQPHKNIWKETKVHLEANEAKLKNAK